MTKIIQPDKESFLKLAAMKIPFGKYTGLQLVGPADYKGERKL